MPKMTAQSPRLSTDLPHEQHPEVCQACGLTAAEGSLDWWQEHDHCDRPEPILVILCRRCSKLLIEPHERLYRLLAANLPWPGAMPLCVECRHRDGLMCRHPDLKANGGEGLILRFQKPHDAHIYFGGGKGQWMTVYPAPVESCAGREAREEQP